MNFRKVLVMSILFFMVLLVGCQAKDETTNPNEGSPPENEQQTPANNPADDDNESPSGDEEDILEQPVTLTLWNRAMGLINDDLVQEFFAPVYEKYPNVKIQLIEEDINDMIASGRVPDLVASSNYYLLEHIHDELAGDMSDFIEERGIDLGIFNSAVAENLQLFGDLTNNPGAIYAMPVSMNHGVLIYNKEVFDKFGVPYPHAGMTWNEIIDLGERVTGTIDGIGYIGFDATGARVLTRAKGLSSVDENGEININTDPGYKEIFEMLYKLYQIPGIVDQAGERYTYGMDFFMKERRLAMFPYWLINVHSRISIMEETGIDWDITTFPAFEETPGLAREVDYHVLAVPSMAENREAALRVLEEVVSEDMQRYLSEKVARLTVLDNEEIRFSFARDSGAFAEKNLEEVLKTQPSPGPRPTIYDQEIYKVLDNIQRKMALEGLDVNTALREGHEEAVEVKQQIDISR